MVKQWRTEGLEALLADDARAAVTAARAGADRDARRARRVADRTASRAAVELERLQCLGVELRAAVRDQRGALQRGVPKVPGDAAVPAPAEAAPAAVAAPPAAAPRRRRPGRASLRSSPLAELFRATATS